MYNKRIIIGTIQKKVLLLLAAGLALGLTHSPKQHFRILKDIPREWRKINQQALSRAIRALYTSKLIEEKYNRDGTVTLTLNDQGKNRTLRFDLDNVEIKTPNRWDCKWRIVMFDIPERLRRLRDSLRFHFKEIGLVEFQKSVFVYPYPCEKEIEFIVEFYNARKYVRFIVADNIDNELHFRKKFKLL